MIVFRDQRNWVEPSRMLSALREAALRLAGGSPHHDAVLELLIEMGTLEGGLDDAIFADADGVHPTARRLRETSCALAHALWHTWRDQNHEAKPWVEQAAAALAYLEQQPMPAKVQIGVPEGYAYYGVYPEMYFEAARRCARALGPFNAVCLGLRSIGTSLSAAVAGALEELGCQVASYTLRPRGHPFDRRPILDSQLKTVLQSERDALFLIVDEGPGISGSSLVGTAELLSELGIASERIMLFPSWSTDGSSLRSPAARARWHSFRQFVGSFEEAWLDSGRLSGILPPGRLRDLSAGGWRDLLYEDSDEFPAVQQQHERRKYLLEPSSNYGSASDPCWLSFAGLGARGRSKLLRAEQLAAAGFTPAPERVAHGFLVRAYMPGAPVDAREGVNPKLLESMASYLAYIAREHPVEPSVTAATMREMIATNVAEGLGQEWLSLVERRFPSSASFCCERPVALDGRMQPHEWIRTSGGYLKTDAVDHHDDHFFPGCQDIAWDVAAACLEFRLQPEARQRLVRRYGQLSGDRTIAARLPTHAVAYLAFRLGYATLAANTLEDTPDGRRFVAAAEHYDRLLRMELSNGSEGLWNA